MAGAGFPPGSGDIYSGRPEQWNQYRRPLDPTTTPLSPEYPPTLSSASSPRTPRGSPTVPKQLRKFADLTLGNGRSMSSGMQCNVSALSPSLLSQNGDTFHGGNSQSSLGPSLTRRRQAFPTDSSGPFAVGSTNHASTVHHRGLEYQSDARMHGSNTGTHSRPPLPPGAMPPHTPVAPEHQGFFAAMGISPAAFDSELYDAMFGSPFGTSIPIDEEAFRPVGVSPQSTTGSQYGAPLPPHPLTGPDPYAQQPNTAGPVGVAPTFKHPNPKAADLWKFYYENFKGSHPLLRACDTEFKEKVGSFKTVQASLAKRKDDGNWTCPIDGETFTRKQNLKHHVQSHLGIKDFECNCGSTFNALSGLKRHEKKCRFAVSSTSPTN